MTRTPNTPVDHNGKALQPGFRVYTVGSMPAENHDDGYVVSISGLRVAWDTGIITPADGDEIAVGQRPEDAIVAIRTRIAEGRGDEDIDGVTGE